MLGVGWGGGLLDHPDVCALLPQTSRLSRLPTRCTSNGGKGELAETLGACIEQPPYFE